MPPVRYVSDAPGVPVIVGFVIVVALATAGAVALMVGRV